MTKTSRLAIRLTALAPVILLGGCLSLGAEPPDSLLTLTSAATAPVGASASGTQQTALSLVEFETPAVLDVTRVPVQVTDSEMAYLKDAVWAEKPSRLFRRLIAETIRSKTGRVVIDGDDPGVVANDRVSGTVRKFGYDVPSSSAVVTFDAVRVNDGENVQTRRFEARVEGVTADAASVGPALNQAANEVAGQVADWVG